MRLGVKLSTCGYLILKLFKESFAFEGALWISDFWIRDAQPVPLIPEANLSYPVIIWNALLCGYTVTHCSFDVF